MATVDLWRHQRIQRGPISDRLLELPREGARDAAQTMMRNNLARLLGDGAARHRAAAATWPAADRLFWAQICEAGWPGLLLPEDAGGWGGSPVDMVMLIESASAHLPPAPLASAFAIAPLLSRCDTQASVGARPLMHLGLDR